MDNSQAQSALQMLRGNLESSATPNMERAIKNKAYIAALVYGLAYIDTMAGYYFGLDARVLVKKLKKRGDGVDVRYEAFIGKYLSPAQSGCDYTRLDLYASLRCPMLHSLMAGHTRKGKYLFSLDHTIARQHGTVQGTTVLFDVPTFCGDVLCAVGMYLSDVEKALSQAPEPSLLTSFKYWWDNGYSILVSAELEQPTKQSWLRSLVTQFIGFLQIKRAG